MSNFKIGFKDYDLVSISEEYKEECKDVAFGFKKKCKDITFGFKSSSIGEHVTVSFESFVVSYYESPYTLNTNLRKYIVGFLRLVCGKTSEMTLPEFIVWFSNRFIDKAIKLNITTESKEYNICLLKGGICSPITASEIAFTLYDLDNSHWRDTKSKMKSVLGTLDADDVIAIAKDKNTVAVCSVQEFLETLKL